MLTRVIPASYLDLVAVPHPLDGGHGESRDLALQPQVPLAGHRHLLRNGNGQFFGGKVKILIIREAYLRLDLLDHLGRLGLAHDVEEGVHVRLAHRVLDEQRVLAVVLVPHFGDPGEVVIREKQHS